MNIQEKKHQKLFEGFPPITTQAWEEKIIKDLKGADYERKLIWNTEEGFKVKPFYRKEDLTALEYLDAYPADFPFTRGENILKNEWLIRQDIDVKDLEKDNRKILDILMKGVNALDIRLDSSGPPVLEQIEKLLANVFADQVELNYFCGPYALNIIKITNQLVEKYNRDHDHIKGSVDYDPLGYFSLHGRFYGPEDEFVSDAIKLYEAAKHLPFFRVFSIDGSLFKNSGATLVEELAFTLAKGNDYLMHLTDNKLSINEIAPKMGFCYAVGSNYFMEIAKLRAGRILWAHIVNAYGPDDVDITRTYIHSETADWNKTLYDPYVNMLRTTTEAMSAILGGANSLLVKGFDQAYGSTTEFAERIGRNQQLLLKEESYLDKVVDPAAGSYYVENLTDAIVNEAWKLFLEVQEQGGYLETFKKGFIQKRIKESANHKDKALASRKKALLGTNQYPNFQEKIDRDIAPEILEPTETKTQDDGIEKLQPYRGGQAFEALRYQTDCFAKENKRPLVFMLTMGNLAMRRARAQFSANLFACAGYEIMDNNGFDTVEEGVQAALSHQADIVVLCSADDAYAHIAPQANDLLKEKALLAVAGYPKDIIDKLKAKGINRFIHFKSNVLETLKEFQKDLQII